LLLRLDCTDVNDFFSSSNSEDFRFSSKPFSFGLLVNRWGLWVFVFFVFGLGFLVEFVIGALDEFLVLGFVFFCCIRRFSCDLRFVGVLGL
jgi:hypothetical protein